ncbi:FAD-dependent oxidoreductase [Pleurocapsales cyanobacterium LEGE 10410]|nr:FAD-dependent oxidoreductase [Pleurocapsales cyanobacterium LEGE 10410]
MPLQKEHDHDVVVIGGGPAGSTIATLLSKQNRDVLLLESEKFPRYHIGESMVPGVVPILDELEVLDKVDAHGFVKKYGATFVWGQDRAPWDVRFCDRSIAAQKYGSTYQVIRSEFDELLLRHAQSKGVDVREEHKVTNVHFDGDRCKGVEFKNSQGQIQNATAKYIVDATGQAAILGRHLNLVEDDDKLRNIATWTYFKNVEQYDGLAAGNILTENTPNGWIWVIPRHDGLTSIGWVTTVDKYRQLLSESIEKTYLQVVTNSAETGRRLIDAEQAQPIRSIRDWSYTCKQFCGPGFLIAGDAAGFVDPLFSTGVWLAMNSGSLGANMLNQALNNPQKEAEFLNTYETAYKNFLGDVLSFVKYFYDAHLPKDSYFGEAQKIVQTDSNWSSRQDFVSLISGLHGLHSLTNRALETVPN